jgi:hypothetical protein
MTLHPACRQVLALIGLIAATTPAAGQGVPKKTLDRPDATFSEPLSSVVGFRAFGPDRVVVADNLEQSIAMLSFSAGTSTPIGRPGDGPGEYGMPGPLFAGPADSTFMLDMGNRRLLVLTPDGRISDATIPLSQSSGIPIFPRGVDARGRIYFDLAGIAMPGLEEAARTGAAPLIRWDRAAKRFDTLTVVHFAPMQPGGPGQLRISLSGGAYEPRDAWAVLPDGRVGLARATDYHVEWLGAAQPVVGPVVAYDPVKIGTDEKNAWADQLASRGLMVTVENGRRRTTRPPRPDITKMEWPEVMPPFTGNRSVLATSDGELWVRRAQQAKAKDALYDVFDARGRRVRQVVLPGNRSVLGFGPGVVFVSRTDDDDLQWIERFKM